MAREDFERFKQEIRSWMDAHPDEYDAFVKEVNGKSFEGIQRCYKFLLDTDARTGNLQKDEGEDRILIDEIIRYFTDAE